MTEGLSASCGEALFQTAHVEKRGKEERKRTMGRKRIAAALLALALTAGTLALPARAAFADTAGHWAETAITKWSEDYSVINGYEDGILPPGQLHHPGGLRRHSGPLPEVPGRLARRHLLGPGRELLGGGHPEAPRRRRLPGQQRRGPGGGHHHPPAGGGHDRPGLRSGGGDGGRPLSGRGSGGGVRPVLSGGDVRQGLYHRLLRRLFPPHGPHHPGGDRDDPGQHGRGADPDQHHL